MTNIFIPHQFVSLNEYINAERSNKFKAAKIKREQTELAMWYFKGRRFKTPLRIKFIWHLKDRRKDLDNVAFACKYILDGMVKASAIENDGLKQIIELNHTYVIDKDIGVEIKIKENE